MGRDSEAGEPTHRAIDALVRRGRLRLVSTMRVCLVFAFSLLGCGAGQDEQSTFTPGAASTATTVSVSTGGMQEGSSSGTPETATTAEATSTSQGPTSGAEDSTSGESSAGGGMDVPPVGPVLPASMRYMMAGDSITDWGHMWRSGVVSGLQEAGVVVETTGPYTDQAGHGHAGLASQQTSFILQNMPAWMADHDPNVINLLIGVNDIRGNIPTDTIAANMTAIVQTIHDASPQCHVFVNAVMRYTGSYGGDPNRVPEVNAAYAAIVDDFAAQGMSIHWVDLYPHVPADEIGDGLHASTDPTGAGLMADVVLSVMLPLVP